MKELGQILQLWSTVQAAGEEAVLATVVKTRGSSYRLPGARLLLSQRGQRAGSVSGGCLEDELVRKAWWLTEKGPVVRRYDTTAENEISTAGYGLGCNGIIHVLLERLRPSGAALLDLLRDVRLERRPALIAHVLEPASDAGRRLIVHPQGHIVHNFSAAALAAGLESPARAALAAGENRLMRLADGREVFLETLAPAVRLLIFGAGDDAVPLTELANYLGWSVSVFDGRPHYARREKFPHAEHVAVTSATTLPSIDAWTVAVLMTHSYSQDLAALRELSSLPLRYLGVLGPAKRTAQLLADAHLDSSGANLHAPMGLDIGADGPEQVALAVVAEIQATLNTRNGGALRLRDGSIHAREADSAAWSPSIVCA